MPIIASVRVRRTRTNTGLADGNVPRAATFSRTPLTEIVAVVGLAEAAAVPAGAVFAGLGAFVPAPDDGELADPPAAGATVPQGPPAHSWICCLNGSLLLNWLNEISWPELGGSGALGSLTPSAEVWADEPVVASLPAADVEPPSSVGGARLVPVVAVVPTATVDAGGVTLPPPLSIFIVRGTWKASTASSSTPPTIASFFCFAAFAATGSTFFAIYWPPVAGAAAAGGAAAGVVVVGAVVAGVVVPVAGVVACAGAALPGSPAP